MVKIIFLTSIGYKILSILWSLGMLTITYAVIFLVDKLYIMAILFSILVTLICLFAVYLSFNHSICKKNRTIILKQLKKSKINIDDIKSIHINDPSFLYDNTIFIETNNGTYRLNGYNSLVKKNNILLTRNIVLKISERSNLPFKK